MKRIDRKIYEKNPECITNYNDGFASYLSRDSLNELDQSTLIFKQKMCRSITTRFEIDLAHDIKNNWHKKSHTIRLKIFSNDKDAAKMIYA